MKLPPYILLEKYVNILALEVPAQGTGSVPVVSMHFRSLCYIEEFLSHVSIASLVFDIMLLSLFCFVVSCNVPHM